MKGGLGPGQVNERSGSVPGFSSLHIVYYIFIDYSYMIVRRTSTSIYVALIPGFT